MVSELITHLPLVLLNLFRRSYTPCYLCSGTCTVTCAGQKIRACIGKVPQAPRLKSLIEKGLVVTVDNN